MSLREIESIKELKDCLQEQKELKKCVIQGLDLTSLTECLLQQDLSLTSFLGCKMEQALYEKAVLDKALVIPAIDSTPYVTCPAKLYRPEELFDNFDAKNPSSYLSTYDARVYDHWWQSGKAEPDSILETLARRLHDHGITDALYDLLNDDSSSKEVVAIMGGHGMSRDNGAYHKVAKLSRLLTQRGFFMASGGGPGAMEATHLGAWFASRDEIDLERAFTILSEFANFDAKQTGNWLAPAFRVRKEFPLEPGKEDKCASLGIPTWLYGHEPPNPFATHIAKYFANSIREEGLMTVATYGIVYSPGSAGTIQEIFQDACQNHYNTVGVVSPMIFLDKKYWTEKKPVYPILEQLAQGQDYAKYLFITDDIDEVVERLEEYRQERPKLDAQKEAAQAKRQEEWEARRKSQKS